MDLRCKPRKDKCCIYLPEIPQTERKGPKDRRKSARRPGLRIPGLIQKIGMVNVHLAVLMHVCSIGRAFESRSKGCRFESGICNCQRVYGFREENQLIVLQDEHLWRPQADIRKSIE